MRSNTSLGAGWPAVCQIGAAFERMAFQGRAHAGRRRLLPNAESPGVGIASWLIQFLNKHMKDFN